MSRDVPIAGYPERNEMPAAGTRRLAPMTIADFQNLIRQRYFATDSARGPAATFVWLAEEFGELAEQVGRHIRGDGDAAHLAEEFADVLAWLATLANISGIDLTAAIEGKYVTQGGPRGTK